MPMRIYILLCLVILFVSCSSSHTIEKEIENIPVSFNIERFDILFDESTDETLHELKNTYPFLFSEQIPDSLWINRLNDSLQIELRQEVKRAFKDINTLNNEIESLFKHLKYYYPDFVEPRVITLISDVDYRHKVKLTDSLLLIALDTYLGENHRYYENIYAYIKKNMTSKQIVSDIASEYAYQKIQHNPKKTFLDEMVLHGKVMYFKDKMIPFKSDAEKIGYTVEELEWAKNNEVNIWQYFVDQEVLFNTDRKLRYRFIDPAPFSKFNLYLDSDSPGQIGIFIGWQIVKSYMKNNQVTLDEMLKKEATEIFNNSKYKPLK